MTTATRTPLARPDEVAVVALGGVLGALARYGISVAVPHTDPAAWPWATFAVNLLGCLLLGVVLVVLDARHADRLTTNPRLARPFLASGVLGGFTTFSTFSVEAVRLAGEGRGATALMYAGSSVVLGVVAVLLGRRLGSAVAGPAPVDLREDEDL